MSGKKVYLETSVIGYLTSRPSRDIIKLAKQELTRQWWDRSRATFELYVSGFVIGEIERGDARAARRRMELVADFPKISLNNDVEKIYERLIMEKAVPTKATTDAMHIALAVAHGMDYLLTWNCAHINNAAQKKKISKITEELGYTDTIIATPEELTR